MFVNKNSNLVCGAVLGVSQRPKRKPFFAASPGGAGGTLGCKAPNPAEVGGVLAGFGPQVRFANASRTHPCQCQTG